MNDNWGSSWSRNVDVTADANGNISDQFNLPNWFAAFYGVVATGSSGVATTTFTDKNVRLTSPDPTRFPASGSQSIAPGATHNFSATIEEAGGNGTTTITGITSAVRRRPGPMHGHRVSASCRLADRSDGCRGIDSDAVCLVRLGKYPAASHRASSDSNRSIPRQVPALG